MKNKKFKVGDKVYCPSTTTKICTVEEFGDVLCVSRNNKEHAPFDQHGISTITRMQFVFHATEENHKKLCDLYGMEFEAPPRQKEPKEIIKAMLDDGWDSVPCRVTDISIPPFTFETVDCIREVRGKHYQGSNWLCRYAVPFDPKTNKIIIDYVDGQPILE